MGRDSHSITHKELPSATLPSAVLPSAARTDAMGRISSDQLFGGLREVTIEHSGQCYRLRMTSTGKLILTK